MVTKILYKQWKIKEHLGISMLNKYTKNLFLGIPYFVKGDPLF